MTLKKIISLGIMASTLVTVNAAENPTRPHRVFAHYMTCFSADPAFYRREIMLAQRYGIDGFALNCGEWKKPQNGKFIATRYITNADRIFQAAKELSPDFKLFMSPDFAGDDITNFAELNVCDMFTRYYQHPNLFRNHGKAVLSGYAGTVEQYAKPAEKLRREGYDVLLVPHPSHNYHPMALSMESTLSLFKTGSQFDGIFRFSCDGTVKDIIDTNATARRATLFADKIFMAGAVPAYNSPNLRDFRGMAGYCSIWEGIINDQADWVEIVTWNDYQEDSNLMPYRWKAGYGNAALNKNLYNRDESYLDVTAYFADSFRNGVRPEITQDKIYFTYRTRSKNMTQVWDEKEKKWADIRFCSWPYDQLHDDVQDAVYVTAFLTAEAELTVLQGNDRRIFKMAKGISSCEAPLLPGAPQFILTRKEQELINVSGRKTIIDTPTPENSVKGIHQAHRTWTSGAAAGPIVKSISGSEKAVEPGAPLELPVKEVAPATYNFRITYTNPSDTEARLTLYADGAPGFDGEQPYYFPLYLPPTGNRTATLSFFWSVWDKTTRFTIRKDLTDKPELAKEDFNDYGSAAIRQIDLIKVDIFRSAPAKSNLPEMVVIPGGEFTMGANAAHPDETPAHQAKISGFALGKYEVTNAEFEKFMPEHKLRRDGFSWRDREPVIYVSWRDAAKYCNWLSRQHGLTPAYDEKTWSININADGFRLPTEAEWEYAASGRGENRIYPWGNQPPTPVLGNFELKNSLSISPERQASTAAGVMVVGSYPAGASRDGIMDMAGNVAEWCCDYFNPYLPDNVLNPLDQRPSHHRVIRGGSWGYYNYSQRNADREFNNDGYPGYIYIGFRLAISAAGHEKLTRKQ